MTVGFSKLDRDTILLAANCVRAGEWFTFGDIAAVVGRPGAAQGVSRVLSAAPGTFPWWRLRNAEGRWGPGHIGDRAQPDAAVAVEAIARVEGVEILDGVASPAQRVSADKLAKRLAKFMAVV